VGDARPAVRLRAAQQSTHAGRKLGHGKGLDHVVIGAQVEAAHAIVHRIARGEHQHGKRPTLVGSLRAQAAQHFIAVHLRQADVQDNEIKFLVRRGMHRVLAARRDVDRVALGLEDALQSRGERGVVFYDQQSHARIIFPPRRAA
jgi:D-alanyl-D-alanine carboxypeptidase/D-alanyl-D-alanine-endopeptidase (penicillin-binding protein 4)